MEIRTDDPRRPPVTRLLEDHLADLHKHSPPESTHALDIDELASPAVTFWTAWDGNELLGCGALLELDPHHGEIKSMRTDPRHVRKGVGRRLLQHIIDESRRRAYRRLSLETGSQPVFAPAHALYASFGFTQCEPFGSYRPDPNSLFMSRELD